MKTLNTQSYPVLNSNGFQVISIDQNSFWQYESGIIQAYKEVFNASAWREWVKCSNGCGFKTTFEESPVACPECLGAIEDFYSNKEISESVMDVLSRSYFQCLLLLKWDTVAWFTWWWKDSIENINDEKLGLKTQEEYSRLISGILADKINSTSWEYYYQSETGVVPTYRTRWIGSAIVGINEELLRSNSNQVEAIIQRTSRQSPMYAIRANLWYSEVFSYDDSDERVLFARNNF
mgnify:FL=1